VILIIEDGSTNVKSDFSIKNLIYIINFGVQIYKLEVVSNKHNEIYNRYTHR